MNLSKNTPPQFLSTAFRKEKACKENFENIIE